METVRAVSEKRKPAKIRPADPLAILLLLFRLLLGGIFLWSGGAKLLDLAAFQAETANFELISWKLSGAVALYLPWLELVCGFALVSGKCLRGALVLLAALMIGFIVAVASAWVRGLDVTCGCFGATDAAVSYPLWIARNLLILAGLIALVVAERWRSGSKMLRLPK